ncbi:hypothetical protein [Halorubrum lipolyticum]|uniref:hypothetical protein n=1 Tax=Halorubrum lipolyticum TaxID=368624 RepID=UPI0011C9950A|nr:hypothetical protein [Halorubrum lipolyticum]
MERRKFVIGLGSLAAGGAAATGTGAFTAAELSPRTANIGVVNDSNGLIGLEPGGTDLVYDEDGQLKIDFNPDSADGAGVNPNSTYQVGGLGGIDNLNEIPGEPDVVDSVETLAIDTDTGIETECAFQLLNQSGEARAVEVTYDANGDFPDSASVYMISHYDSGSDESEEVSALVAKATPDARRASILYTDDADWSEDVGSGDTVKVSLIVEVGDTEPPADLSGEITVRAGSHDDFIDPDPPE